MPNLNRVLLMGNLTRDPELRYLPSNMPVVNLGIATNRRWRNQQGEQQEETTFVDCEAFGRTAEVINQYLRKGRPLFVEGRLRLDQWQDREGQNRSKLKVIVENFEFVDSRNSPDESPRPQGAGSGPSGYAYPSPSPAPGGDPGTNPGTNPGRTNPGGSPSVNPGAIPGGNPGAGVGPVVGAHQPVPEEDIPF